MKTQVLSRMLFVVMMMGAVLFGVASAQATTYTWDTTVTAGIEHSWTNAANWVGGEVPNPVAGDTIDFFGSSGSWATGFTVNLEADRTATTWKFNRVGTAATTFFIKDGYAMILAGDKPTIEAKSAATAYAYNFDCEIRGTNGLTKTGPSRINLNNTGNTFTGGITVEEGYLQATSDGALGTNDILFAGQTGYWIGAATTISPTITVTNDAVMTFYYPAKNTFTTTGPIVGEGTIYSAISGICNLLLHSTNNTFTGPFHLGGVNKDAGTGTGGIAYVVRVNSFADSTNPIVFYSGGTGQVSFRLGSGAVAPLVFNQRPVRITNTRTGSAAIINENTDTNNTITIVQPLEVTSPTNQTFVLEGVNTGANTFAGAISDGTNSVVSLSKAGNGTWILSGNNTFSGTTTVSGGTLVLAGSQCLSDTNVLSIASGKYVQLEAGVKEKVGTLVLGTSTNTAAAIWGATDNSKAEQTTTSLLGTGLLYVNCDPPPQGTIIGIR